MTKYYYGDLEKDLKTINEKYHVSEDEVTNFDKIGKNIGYGRSQQLIDNPTLELSPAERDIISVYLPLVKKVGKQNSKEILQILWAKYLKEAGLPTSGALIS